MQFYLSNFFYLLGGNLMYTISMTAQRWFIGKLEIFILEMLSEGLEIVKERDYKKKRVRWSGYVGDGFNKIARNKKLDIKNDSLSMMFC